jgi:hypothetical protein
MRAFGIGLGGVNVAQAVTECVTETPRDFEGDPQLISDCLHLLGFAVEI